MAGESIDWAHVLDRLLVGDRVAAAHVGRLITATLAALRAYDFREEWDDLRQEVLLAVVASACAGRLRDPALLVAYVRVVTRDKFMDRLRRHLRRGENDPLPWDDATTGAEAG